MTTSDNNPVESSKIIIEVEEGSYEMVRVTRIKYKNNPLIFIDIRVFQRGYNHDSEPEYHPTKKGVQIKEKQFKAIINQYIKDNLDV